MRYACGDGINGLSKRKQLRHNEPMIAPAILTINKDERFRHLPNAPIIEAVIDIRSRPTALFDESTMKSRLDAKLDGYHLLDLIFQEQTAMQGGMSHIEQNWKGLRYRSADEKYIAQFHDNRFIFSRLEPYQSWDRFYYEGMRLWSNYIELAKPSDLQRIGLRYINRIQLPVNELHFEDYLHSAPTTPKDFNLPFLNFLHQDTFEVPGHPYAINITKTIQPPKTQDNQGLSLILDIDIFTNQEPDFAMDLLEQRLIDMHWLKNKVFFGSITDKAMTLFQ